MAILLVQMNKKDNDSVNLPKNCNVKMYIDRIDTNNEAQYFSDCMLTNFLY